MNPINPEVLARRLAPLLDAMNEKLQALEEDEFGDGEDDFGAFPAGLGTRRKFDPLFPWSGSEEELHLDPDVFVAAMNARLRSVTRHR